MNINEELWSIINGTPKLSEEMKKSLYTKIGRLFEQARQSPAGKKHGVTIMTQEASLAGDKVAQDRRQEWDPNGSKPKNI